jgi:hypothetical protein
MDIAITKLSDAEHRVSITRRDGSTESATMVTREFLRHDFAHFIVETEVPVALGYWGCVAAGASLTGEGTGGRDIAFAETLAGPVQTLMRLEATSDQYLDMLERIQPQIATQDLAQRIFECARQLAGHWRATPFGETMHFEWQEQDTK